MLEPLLNNKKMKQQNTSSGNFKAHQTEILYEIL
jgi:hypothetical protein